MNRDEIVDTLRRSEAALRSRGVLHAALFGSVARDMAGPDSDIDIIIDIEPDLVEDIYAYVGLKTFIAQLFSGPVDVVDRAALKPHLRAPAKADGIYAF